MIDSCGTVHLCIDTRSASPRVNLHIGMYRYTDTVLILYSVFPLFFENIFASKQYVHMMFNNIFVLNIRFPKPEIRTIADCHYLIAITKQLNNQSDNFIFL